MSNKKIKISFIIIIILGIIIVSYLLFFNNKSLKINSEGVETKIVNLRTTLEKSNSMPTYSGYNVWAGSYDEGKYGDHIILTFNKDIREAESINDFTSSLVTDIYNVVQISVPEKQQVKLNRKSRVNTIPVVDDYYLKPKIYLDSYENGWLKGRLEAKVTNLKYGIEDQEDPNCRIDDMSGFCNKNIPSNINLIVNFETQIK